MKVSKLLVGLFACAMSLGAYADAPIVIKFSHVVANDTPKGKGSLKFKELAEKARTWLERVTERAAEQVRDVVERVAPTDAWGEFFAAAAPGGLRVALELAARGARS